MPSISNEKFSISNKKPSILINSFDKKATVFQIKKFEIRGISHITFEILVILEEIPDISKAWNFECLYRCANNLLELFLSFSICLHWN